MSHINTESPVNTPEAAARCCDHCCLGFGENCTTATNVLVTLALAAITTLGTLFVLGMFATSIATAMPQLILVAAGVIGAAGTMMLTMIFTQIMKACSPHAAPLANQQQRV